jgi:hypothetical protein
VAAFSTSTLLLAFTFDRDFPDATVSALSHAKGARMQTQKHQVLGLKRSEELEKIRVVEDR